MIYLNPMEAWKNRAIHTAVGAVWGKADRCEKCKGVNQSKRYEWSNKNHKYKLLRKDWWRLCATCHRRYDRKKFGYRTWNKGRKGRQPNHNSTGLVPGGWNKGQRERENITCCCGRSFYPPKRSSRFCSKNCAMVGNKRAAV